MTLTIGVSGINAVDNPGPGVGVARSLREAADLDVRIVGLAYDAMEPGIYMDWIVDEAFLIPYPTTSQDAYRERLLYIREQTGMDFVIPTLDTEMPFYMKYCDELADLGIGEGEGPSRGNGEGSGPRSPPDRGSGIDRGSGAGG